MPTRRQVLKLGGGSLVALTAPRLAFAARVEVIEMRGTSRGEHVWFMPSGLAVTPGTTVRFVNRDPVNSHTATAYHPDLFGRPRRIPRGAAPWNSDFLLPDQIFEIRIDRPGVYDYYCVPHEMAGMVGRIVAGRPGDNGWQGAAAGGENLPAAALASFPEVDKILTDGRVEPEHRS